jgi:excisionase family DNA binding protein
VKLELELTDAQLAAIAEKAAELVAEHLERHDRDGFLDVAGAAEFLACKPDRIYALKSAGRIPFYKDGSRLLFDREELREWVRNGGGKRP